MTLVIIACKRNLMYVNNYLKTFSYVHRLDKHMTDSI